MFINKRLLICMSIGDSFQLPCTTLTEYHKSLLYNDERVKNTAYIRNVIPHDMSKELDPDFPPNDDEYKGDIDWDAEWKKVVTNKDQPKERPGQYKTDLEIAATKAKVAAEKKLMSVKQETRRMTNFNTLKGDWKFWIGILVIISIGTSLISGAGQTSYENDSFYI